MDINYLDAIDSVLTAQPHVNLEYQATPQTVVSAQFGSASRRWVQLHDGTPQPAECFPADHPARWSPRDGATEPLGGGGQSSHWQVGPSASRAAYHDGLRNAAVWGLGNSAYGQAFAGNSLPNPAGNGIVINGGNYQSAGFRAVYAQTFGSHLEVLGAYSSGRALSARDFVMQGSRLYSQGALLPEQTNSLIGKITADLPCTHTRFSTSYEWVPNDRVTLVDPAGQANLQVQPYLGVQIRQPIPTPSFLPVHIDAVADFQNLLSQGYVPSRPRAVKNPWF